MLSHGKALFGRASAAMFAALLCASFPAQTPHLKPTTVAPPTLVSGIRHWSTPTYTRIVIDLNNSAEFEAARVPNPDRIYFDIHNAHLAPELAGKSFAVTDGFLTRIRAAQISPQLTRIVLDVHDLKQYSAFLLPNPYRLIVDIHGIPDPHAKPIAPAKPVPAPITAPSAPAAVEISSLPPMPVTGSELAAVSRDPGKVAGTHHPTSQPVVSNAAPPPPDTFAASAHAEHPNDAAFKPRPLSLLLRRTLSPPRPRQPLLSLPRKPPAIPSHLHHPLQQAKLRSSAPSASRLIAL